MSDMPEWRAWADAAHRDSLRARKYKRKKPVYCKHCNAGFLRQKVLDRHIAKKHEAAK